ncbi:MAG: hypothetical protein A4E57_04489 [Syntrophorhabdaceae bacterium PtaU1.Bin034]|nr:MAG: hypothetical protein A4E57_04489 [Syntrophorhabdaceae bacterium PtaU1.Bin034]
MKPSFVNGALLLLILVACALNGCASSPSTSKWDQAKHGFGNSCTGLAGLGCIPWAVMQGVDSARSLGKGQQYEIDGEIVTAEQVKAQAYKYRPGDPQQSETAQSAEAKNNPIEGGQKASSDEAVMPEPKDKQEGSLKREIPPENPAKE